MTTRTLLRHLGIGIAAAFLALSAIACGSALDKKAGSGGAAPQVPAARGEADSVVSGSPEDALGAAAVDQAPEADPRLQGVLDRKIIQSTSVDVGVEEVSRSFQEIIRIATTAGGFVSSSSFSNVDDQQVADLTIRVPGDAYQPVLAQIRGMGEVATESSDAQDATEEYTDLQARLRTLQATEQRYLELLARAETIPDILTVQDRLDSVRGQIEQVQGRINLLDHLTELATITIHVRPIAAAADGGGIHPINAAQNAWGHSLEALRGLAAAALVVAVFSWWLLPPLAVFAFAARWWAARHQAPNTRAT